MERLIKPLPRIILIIGSASQRETDSMLMLFNEAFPDGGMFRAWFRPHPQNPWRETFDRIRSTPEDMRIEVMTGEISEQLNKAWIVVGGESGLTVDALAFGCEVVSPVLNDCMFQSPLGGHEEYYHKVYGPKEFREKILSLI